MADDKVVVLNNYPAHFAALRRTRPSGKTRVTIDVKSEALGIVTDERALAMMLAQAFAEDVRQGIRDVGTFASQTIRKARQTAKRAFDAGEAWAKKKYGGGRIGAMAPNQTQRDLNDSGRLAKSVAAMPTKDASTVVVNVAANRLTPDAYPYVWPKLQPIIQEAIAGKRVLEAGSKIAKELVQKAKLSNRDARRELIDKLGQSLEKLSNLGRELEDLSEEP